MRIIYRRCCGMDVHKKKLTVCVMSTDGVSPVQVRKRAFGTYTRDVKKLRHWLLACKVTHVAMESTGVYGKPVWNVLEGKFTILLVNAAHYKGVDGRQTDQIDCEWLAELLQCGLLKASFIAPQEIRELRDLTRMRVPVVQEENRVQNRIEKVLESANIKLSVAVSDTLGVSGKLMLKAIIRGQEDPGWLADYARGSLRSKRKELELALAGKVTDHHRFLLQECLDPIEFLEGKVARLEGRIGEMLQPHADLIRRLDAIAGVDEITAWTLLAEIGWNMDVFQTSERLASWAGMCPGNRQSAGKRSSGKTRKGNRWLRRALVQCGWAAARAQDSYLRSVFWRIAGRQGKKKAAVAVGHRILKIAFYLVRDGVEYQDLGPAYFDRLNPVRTAQKLVHRLERLGFAVNILPASAQAIAEGGSNIANA